MNEEDRISDYMAAGGLFNPELMDHEKVRELLFDCRATIRFLRRENAKLTASIAPHCEPTTSELPNIVRTS